MQAAGCRHYQPSKYVAAELINGRPWVTFAPPVWRHFHPVQITDRLEHWRQVAVSAKFRRIEEVVRADDVRYQLAPLPTGYVPFLQILTTALTIEEKQRLAVATCEALAELHAGGFCYGFLSPEWMHFHPESLDVILDVQPFPSCYAFVDGLPGAFPPVLLSRFARSHNIMRPADFYALGVHLYWLFSGELPNPVALDVSALPEHLQALCARLILQPETFLFASQVSAQLSGDSRKHALVHVQQNTPACDWLQPAPPPLSARSQAVLRRFLLSRHPRVLAVVDEDETARVDVIRHHINEVIERNHFITVTCRNLPFATLRETIDRVLFGAQRQTPELPTQWRILGWRLEQILQRHSESEGVVNTLAEWLRDFCQELLPALQCQRIYIVFEACEEFDSESLRVLVHFWRNYQHLVPMFQVILTGRQVPGDLPSNQIPALAVGGRDSELYRGLVAAQCPGLHEQSLQRLASWFSQRMIPAFYVRFVIEDLVQRSVLTLDGNGWNLRPDTNLDLIDVNPEVLVLQRLAQLEEADLQFLRVMALLPSPVRARRIFLANQLDMRALSRRLTKLTRLGLLRAYHTDSVFVPREVREVLMAHATRDEYIAAAASALSLQHTYRPRALPPLIALARLAEDALREYHLLIHYFREVRGVLSVEAKRDMLERIAGLQERLERPRTKVWKRLLCEVYYRCNEVDRAAQLAEDLYRSTGDPRDRLAWILYRMFENKLDLPPIQRELMDYVASDAVDLPTRVRAALVLTRSDLYCPLTRASVHAIDRFYQDSVFPRLHTLPTRLFVELTINYTIMLFQYFPEREDYAVVLLELLESMLADTSDLDMMSRLHDAYVFHSDIRVSRRYIQRQLDLARRSGAKLREQICHTNGMELALYQGDVAAYLFHRRELTASGEIRRRDLVDQILLHQLNYACEWEEWGLFDQIHLRIQRNGLTPANAALWQVYERLAAYRRGLPLPPVPDESGGEHFTSFLQGLYALQAGDPGAAARCFQQSIAANPYHLAAGWSYRELIQLLLAEGASDTGQWLHEFGAYLKRYRYDVFWPDFYYLSAHWALQAGDLQQAILFFRRAVNGYQLIGKDKVRSRVEVELRRTMQPSYLRPTAPVLAEPAARRLLAERTRLLNQTLDLLVILQMSEHVTETLDLYESCERLMEALFEYFPIARAALTFELDHLRERRSYNASGVLAADLAANHAGDTGSERLSFELYRRGSRAITLDLAPTTLWDSTAQRNVSHFLSVIRSHIANSVHYLAMMTDNLTGFYQRQYFLERLEQEFLTSTKYGLDLSILMLDLDDFRTVNEFGHPEGDRVLQEVAALIRSSLRKMDIPGRYGGEELLIILPKTGGQAAMRMAQRLRERIAVTFAGRPYRVTVSIGVASLQMCGATSPEELVLCADMAEIRAKSTGKNKAVAAWTILPTAPVAMRT